MKVYGESDVRRATWGGVKPLLKAPLYSPLINRVVVAAARALPASKTTARIPVVRPWAEYRTGTGQVIKLLDPHRCSVARNAFWANGSLPSAADRHVMRSLEVLVAGSATFLDIGAYSGLFSLVAARVNPEIRAIAFEILPQSYELLVRNVIANDLVGRVDPRLCGLGLEAGALVMPLATGLSALPTSLSIGSAFESGVRIPVDTLDNQVGDRPGPVAIKIDVEGFEAEVLEGGPAFLARTRPDFMCEILPDATSAARIEAVLRPLGYRFLQYTDGGLVARDAIRPSAEGRDWLLTTRTDLSGHVLAD